MKRLNKRQYADYWMIFAGTGCMALGIQWFYDPAGLVTGGFTGIAIIVKRISQTAAEGGIPLWLTNLSLNIPVFLAALKIKGRQFVGRTGIATVLLSAWLYVIQPLDMTQNDPMLAAVFGGVISGAGIGLVLLAKATTGGTDMVSALVQKKLRHYSVVQIMPVLIIQFYVCFRIPYLSKISNCIRKLSSNPKFSFICNPYFSLFTQFLIFISFIQPQ